jgi:hypothetical protein
MYRPDGCPLTRRAAPFFLSALRRPGLNPFSRDPGDTQADALDLESPIEHRP